MEKDSDIKNYMGRDGFIWFIGVVEDRNDPLELGRVRVRCLGYHTDDLSAIPTSSLPWAHVCTQLQTHLCMVWERLHLF